MKRLFILILLVLAHGAGAQTYLSEDFEGAFTGDVPAPAGWTQTLVVLSGDAVPEPPGTVGNKAWLPNTWDGESWALRTSTEDAPEGAFSGTGALWHETRFTGSLSNVRYNAARIESPAVDLSTATSPYVRFAYSCDASSSEITLRVVASADGGTTWEPITPVASQASVAWEEVAVPIPAPFRVDNARFGIEIGNSFSFFGGQNAFVDAFRIEEFTPTSVTAVASATPLLWSDSASWVGGVPPTALNDVVVPAGTEVQVDVPIARCQDLLIEGTFSYENSTSSFVVELAQAFGDVTVAPSGLLTVLKRIYLNGDLTVNGQANLTGAANVFFSGGRPTALSGTGMLVGGLISNVSHVNPRGFTYARAASVGATCGLYYGEVNPNGNLTLGSPSTPSGGLTVERATGSFTAAPAFSDAVAVRNVHYVTPSYHLTPPEVLTPGFEIADSVTGRLRMRTYNHLELTDTLTVGTTAGGQLELDLGIVITSETAPLVLNPAVTGADGSSGTGAEPSATTAGAYVAGPLVMRLPLDTAADTGTRYFPVGVGTDFIAPDPSPNNRFFPLTLDPGATAWNGQMLTAEALDQAPAGDAPAEITTLTGNTVLRLSPAGSLSDDVMLSVDYFGNAGLIGNLPDDLRLLQAEAPDGPWAVLPSTPEGDEDEGTLMATAALGSGDFLAFGSASSPTDVGVVAILAPVSGCGLSDAAPVTVRLRNFGVAPLPAGTTVPVSYALNGTPVATEPFVLPEDLPVNGFTTYTFVTGADVSAPGSYTIDAQTELANDGEVSNDATLGYSFFSIPFVDEFPYVEGFNEDDGDWFSTVVSGSNDQWVWGLPVFEGDNVEPLAPGSTAWATVVDGVYSNSSSNQALNTPCFDLRGLADPRISFFLRIESRADRDAMVLEVSDDEGENWTKVDGPVPDFYNNESELGSVTPPKWSGSNGEWQSYSTPLPALADSSAVRFRFRFQNSFSFFAINRYGFAVDSFTIAEGAADIRVAELLAPATGANLSAAEQVSVRLVNAGTEIAAGTTIPLRVRLDDVLVGTDTLTLSEALTTGSSVSFPTDVTLDLAAPGSYAVSVVADWAEDTNPSNDSLARAVVSIPVIETFPYEENFNAGPGNWFSESLDANPDDWEWGLPTQSELVSPNAGSSVWATRLAENYTNDVYCALNTPFFDLTAQTNMRLNFWMRYRTEGGLFDLDGADLQASVDSGQTWTKVTGVFEPFYDATTSIDEVDAPKWSGDNEAWTRYVADLSPYDGAAELRLRFRFASSIAVSAEGFAIDSVQLAAPTEEVTPLALAGPTSDCLSEAEVIEVLFRNSGVPLEAEAQVAFSYAVSGGTVRQDTLTLNAPLAVGDSLTFAFEEDVADLSVAASYQITTTAAVVGSDVEQEATFTVENFRAFDPTVAPFANGAEAGELGGWRLFNFNLDGSAWGVTSEAPFVNSGARAYFYAPSPTNAAEDYLVSNCVTLSADTSYLLSYHYRAATAAGTSERMRVVLSAEVNPQQAFDTLADYPSITNTAYVIDTVVLTVPADGAYYLGFEAYSEANQSFLLVDDIAIVPQVITGLSGPDSRRLLLYPNPTAGRFTVRTTDRLTALEVTDLTGRRLRYLPADGHDAEVDLRGYAPGVYLIRVHTETGTAVRKVMLK